MTSAGEQWSVYLLRCRDGTFYTGIATDVARRVGEHQSGRRGAKYLRGRSPFELVYQHAVGDRSTATRVEYHLKKLRRAEKQDLAALPARVDSLIERFAAAEESPGA